MHFRSSAQLRAFRRQLGSVTCFAPWLAEPMLGRGGPCPAAPSGRPLRGFQLGCALLARNRPPTRAGSSNGSRRWSLGNQSGQSRLNRWTAPKRHPLSIDSDPIDSWSNGSANHVAKQVTDPTQRQKYNREQFVAHIQPTGGRRLRNTDSSRVQTL